MSHIKQEHARRVVLALDKESLALYEERIGPEGSDTIAILKQAYIAEANDSAAEDFIISRPS